MAITRFLDHMRLAIRASGLWIRYATLQNLIPCAPTPSTLAQSKERKGSNFAIWQPWRETQGKLWNEVMEEAAPLRPDKKIFPSF